LISFKRDQIAKTHNS